MNLICGSSSLSGQTTPLEHLLEADRTPCRNGIESWGISDCLAIVSRRRDAKRGVLRLGKAGEKGYEETLLPGPRWIRGDWITRRVSEPEVFYAYILIESTIRSKKHIVTSTVVGKQSPVECRRRLFTVAAWLRRKSSDWLEHFLRALLQTSMISRILGCVISNY